MMSIKKYLGTNRKFKPIIVIVLISSFIFILDQLTKFFVVHILDLSGRLSITVISGFINFNMAWNEGINFGLFANSSEIMRIVLIIVSILICIGIFFWAIKQNSLLLLVFSSAIIGGAVADFLNITCCGIYNPFSFNIADISIFLGVV